MQNEHFAQRECLKKITLLYNLCNMAQLTGRTLNCNPDNGHVLNDSEAMSYWEREYEPGWKPVV